MEEQNRHIHYKSSPLKVKIDKQQPKKKIDTIKWIYE